ncbi:hypothetical protein Tsubulata_037528 [Turnera subulata]|uniref:Anaphase-promoting complex subunit 4 WD40 domain-containing protein n=1 Tax=Turnera subulata TaxID=218843 RepID=A0A9Q0JLE4_9ROSI|nr:hypothetical protein Tsubulata_037528 [Turnera subulata]
MLLAGTYEKQVFGYRLKPTKTDPETGGLTLTRHFTHAQHRAPVTCAALAGPIGATGAGDDTIRSYDMPSQAQLGLCPNNPATPSSLAFYTPAGLSFPRNLLSGNADGSICIFDADPFVHLITLNIHRRAVNDLAVHSSGKLALSVGADRCLAITNLVRGRRSYHGGIGKEASLVKFIGDEEKFFMVQDSNVGIHSTEDARLVAEFESPKRIHSAAPGEHGLLFTGGEDRNITAWDTSSGKAAYCIEGAHSTRVKGIVVLTRNGANGDDDHPYLLASGSSDGIIRVWDVRNASKEKPNPLAEVNLKSRLTCLAGSTFKCEYNASR